MILCEDCGDREAVHEVTIEVNDEERRRMVCQPCAQKIERERESDEDDC